MKWREKKWVYPHHYEEHVGRVCGLTLCVRGPRGGHTYKWTIERVETGTQAHIEIAHGVCVERDLAQHAAEHRARAIHAAGGKVAR